MNDQEADNRAKQLFGPRVSAIPNKHNDLLDIVISDYPVRNIFYLIGWGHTWEEALECAEARSQFSLIRETLVSVPVEPVQLTFQILNR